VSVVDSTRCMRTGQAQASIEVLSDAYLKHLVIA
jgi:hypothetical protein